MIRFDPEEGKLANLDRLIVRGVDVGLEMDLPAPVRLGGSASFADSHEPGVGSDTLPFLPRHRADAWLAARIGRFRGRARAVYVGEQFDV